MDEIQEKYKVLLVDDEPIILRSLKVAIPWDDLQMEIVGRGGSKWRIGPPPNR